MISVKMDEIDKWASNDQERAHHKREVLTMIGTDVVAMIKTEMTDNDAWVTGETGAKLDYVVKDKGVVILGAGYTSKALETGRKPGSMPPIGSLKRWARLKLGDEGLAFAVARKIRDKGTPAKRLLSNVFDRLVRDVLPQRIDYLKERWTQ